jgi:hypothetical protein
LSFGRKEGSTNSVVIVIVVFTFVV